MKKFLIIILFFPLCVFAQVEEEEIYYDSETEEIAVTEYIEDAAEPTSNFRTKEPSSFSIVEKPDQHAMPMNGFSSFYNWLNNRTYYPWNAETDEGGYVILRLVIDKEGNAYNPEVYRSMGPAFDNAAINSLKKYYGLWLPATHKGKPVDSYLYIPVRFQKNNYGH